jgi:hypothetical protein
MGGTCRTNGEEEVFDGEARKEETVRKTKT